MAPDVGGEPLRQQFRIDALATLWLPAAYVPRQVDSDAELSFDTVSSSLILRDRDAGGELALHAGVGRCPTSRRCWRTARIRCAPSSTPSTCQVAALDPGVSELVSVGHGAGAEDPYQQDAGAAELVPRRASATTTASTSPRSPTRSPPSSRLGAASASSSPRRSRCSPASSACRAAWRSGSPRATPCGRRPVEQVGDAVEFVVRGRHAHAWPEVYFEGIGWVPFEPTPQRGNPQAQGYTGVAPDQASAPPEQAATTTSTIGAPVHHVDRTPTSTPTSSTPLQRRTSPPASAGSTAGWLLGAVFVVVALGLVGAARRVRRASATRTGRSMNARGATPRSPRRGPTPYEPSASSGCGPTPSETPLEFARRADGHLGEQMIDAAGQDRDTAALRRRHAVGVDLRRRTPPGVTGGRPRPVGHDPTSAGQRSASGR